MSDQPVSIRVPAELLAELDRFAVERHISRKDFILASLRQAVDNQARDQAVVASVDSVAEQTSALEQRLSDKLACGLGEINNRLDTLEELQAHHLFNFLAHVAAEADLQTAEARGRQRMLGVVEAMEAVRTGRMQSLMAKAKMSGS